MKRLPVSVALVVVALAITGALLHPLAMLLSLSPISLVGLVGFLGEVRTVIADLLGWGLVALVVVMVGYVVKNRLLDRTSHALLASGLDDYKPADPLKRGALKFVVAVTAYNDAEATAQTVREFWQQPGVLDVLVIDNNSMDDTADRARAAGAVVIHEPQQGYGFACIRGLTEGLKRSNADVILLTEGDGTFVASDTAKFLAYMDHADLVVGNRTVRGMVEADSQMDHFFTWGNMAVAMLLRLRAWDGRFLGPAGLSDVGCTFRAIRRDALERILPELSVGGNHFSPHMLLVALARHLSVVEIPIRFRRRVGESKGASRSLVSGIRVGLAMIWYILTFVPSGSDKPGVVVERNGFVIRPSRNNGTGSTKVEFVPGSAERLALLSRRGHHVFVVGGAPLHNAGGLSHKLSRAINARIAAEVEHRGGRVEAFLMCPHDNHSECSCWHPEPELLVKAARRSRVDLKRSVVVSDRTHFLDAAARLGCTTVRVGNGMNSNDSVAGGVPEELAGVVSVLIGRGTESAADAATELQAIS